MIAKLISRVAIPTIHSYEQCMSDLVFFVSSLAFGIVIIFNFNHSDKYVVMSHCGFNWHFPYG